MNTLLRILGIQLVAAAAARLPGGLARVATAVVLVVVNLLPVWAVTTERIGMGDVFLVYWMENVVVWACGTVRTATAEGSGGPTVTRRRGDNISSAGFFALHYGIFTLVHGVFAVIVAALVGLRGGLGHVLLLSLAIAASHLFSLGVNWFGREERKVVSPSQAMAAPYPRMLVLHVGILIGFGVALDGWEHGQNGNDQVAAVAALCGLKTLVDLGFHVWQHRSRQVTRGGEGLYGEPAPQE
jgi:hypothetical protein